MRITKEQLQQIIKEELESLIREKEESPEILHDKDGAERENVPLVVKQRARVKRAQGDLK